MRYLKAAGCLALALVCGLSALATATVMDSPDAADWTMAGVNVVGVVMWSLFAADLTVRILTGDD